MKKILLSIVAAAAASTLCGQTLNKEITVERDIVPRQREATRLGFTPSISLRPLTLNKLSYSESGVTAPVTPSITVLNPAAYGDSIYVTPYNGYAAISLGTLFSPSLSAGYRLVNNETTRLGVAVQYDGSLYKREFYSVDKYFRRHDANVALSLHQLVGRTSALDFDIDYGFTRFNTPGGDFSYNQLYNQNVHNLKVGALWGSTVNDLYYSVGAGFSRFAFVNKPLYTGNPLLESYAYSAETLRPMRQNVIKLAGQIGTKLSEESSAELNVEYSELRNSHSIREKDYSTALPSGNGKLDYFEVTDPKNTWLVRLTPRYRLESEQTTLDLGVRVDISHGSGKAFHIAPDLMLGFKPSSSFAVTLRATGGEYQNTEASIFAWNPYISPLFSYTNSHIPIDASANITIGPFAGAYIELFGGYAIANDWIGPYDISHGIQKIKDVKGWHAGAALGYRYGTLIDARVSFEAAPHDSSNDHFYYLWRDQAGKVVEASLKLHPMKPLDVNVGYEFRGARSLRPVSNLSLGAAWAFTQQLTAFVNGENLLNRSYMLIGDVPAQGLNVRVGASYKF